MNPRQQRGIEIASRETIVQKGGVWLVPSQSGRGKYTVCPDPTNPHCSCPDHEEGGFKCKHLFAVEIVQQRLLFPDGTEEITQSVTVTKTVRRTYTQDWPNYNEAQTTEKRRFQALLSDLCRPIPEPEQKRGRPRIPLCDALFSAIFKVYSTFSGRRFMTDLGAALDKGHIARLPHYNSVFNIMESPTVTPILRELVTRSSLPLKAVESDFAVDSTGFSTTRFVRWIDQKYGNKHETRTWIKAHVMCGVKTNVITSCEVADRHSGDYPQFAPMVRATAENFPLGNVAADKAYLGHSNLELVASLGGVPFIPFKVDSTAGSGGVWNQMFHYFSFRREVFLQHYHQRSNVESTFSMLKRKFGDSLRSKTDVAMVNEVLCKIVAHNICCVIHAVLELGIEATFGDAEPFPQIAGRV